MAGKSSLLYSPLEVVLILSKQIILDKPRAAYIVWTFLRGDEMYNRRPAMLMMLLSRKIYETNALRFR